MKHDNVIKWLPRFFVASLLVPFAFIVVGFYVGMSLKHSLIPLLVVGFYYMAIWGVSTARKEVKNQVKILEEQEDNVPTK